MAYDDPGRNRASAWLEGESLDPRAELQVVDVPINRSVTPGSCDLAPDAIRKVLQRYSTHAFHDFIDVRGVQVTSHPETSDVGALTTILSKGITALIGGDNGVTRLGVAAMKRSLNLEWSQIGLITLDAHLDVRSLDDGPTNGNPVRGLLEDGLLGSNIVQVGVQSFANSPQYVRFAHEAGIRSVTAEVCLTTPFDILFESELERLADRCEAMYFDLDLDVMDRVFAPGCPGSRPGGLTPLHAQQAARIAGSHPKVKAMDLVELDPTIDINDCTAMAAASCLLSFAAGMLGRP